MEKPFLYKVEPNAENLKTMQQQYHEVRGHPAFLREFLACNPSSNAIRMLLNHPEFISWAEDGSFVLMPNYPYIDREALEKDPKHYKNRKEGLSLNAWFVHPKQLEESVFSNPEIRSNPSLIQQSYSYAPSLEKTSDVARLADQQRIREMEQESGVRYFASVLDLKKEDVAWLKNLKAKALENLQKEYSVDSSDKVDLFFHGLISLGTTTLHLHVRVNQKISAVEKQNSIGLDEIISGLESGKNAADILGEHEVIYHSIAKEDFPKVSEGTVRVKNPFTPARGFEAILTEGISSLLEVPQRIFADMVGGNYSSVATSRV